MLGLLLIGVGFLVEGLVPTLAAVLAAQALYSLGATLMDGADAAWIADELGAERAGPVNLRATQIGWLATLPASPSAPASAACGSPCPSRRAVRRAGRRPGAGHARAALRPPPRGGRGSWRQMGRTLRAGAGMVRRRPVLLSVLGVAALFGMFNAGFGRLWQYHLLHSFAFPALGGLKPVVWFGVIEAVIALTSAAGIEVARRRVDTGGHRAVAWALFATDGLMVAGALGFALAGQFALALAALWLLTTASGPRIPLEHAWMNQNLDASVRATVFSLRGQVDALAGIIGGPRPGASATAFPTRVALAAAGLVLAPTLLLYARAARRSSPGDAGKLRMHPY